jgi:hypothetical protein
MRRRPSIITHSNNITSHPCSIIRPSPPTRVGIMTIVATKVWLVALSDRFLVTSSETDIHWLQASVRQQAHF